MTVTPRKISRYGWKPDLPDQRDFKFYKVSKPVPLPDKVSLRDKLPPVFDQGDLGSCTANASLLAVAFEHGGGPYSRLFQYYNSRLLEGTVSSDDGAQIRDAVKALAKFGSIPELELPYVVSRFADKPSAQAYSDAKSGLITSYNRLVSKNDYRQCLAQGFPFIIGITVYESFESDTTARTGIVFRPKKTEQTVGGHAITIVGYDNAFYSNSAFLRSGLPKSRVSARMYEARNSWGSAWGDAGNFWIPASYLENRSLSDDAWTIRK